MAPNPGRNMVRAAPTARPAIFLRRTWLAAMAITWTAITAVPAWADPAGIQPGVYDELLIGYDASSRTLSGYFHSETGGGQFSCIFYLTGKPAGGAGRVETYFPETPEARIGGTITTGAGGRVTLVLDEEPGGCAMVQPFADKSRPASFDLAGAHPWTQVRVVRSKTSYFYNAPGAATHRKGYLVRGDGVGVKGAAGGWLQVEYPNPDQMNIGWMREIDFYPRP